MEDMLPFDQAAGVLPFELRQLVRSMPKSEQSSVEEFRLRIGRPLSVVLRDREKVLPRSPDVSGEDLRTTLEIATQASVHAAMTQIQRGFVTIKGGHRIGLCGTAVLKGERVYNLRDLSSLNVRIARQMIGIGETIIPVLRQVSVMPSVLILAPPGVGKTTLLRDMIRCLSCGIGGLSMRVGVADERGELAAIYKGVPQFDLGPQTDVVDGCSKADGLMMLLRGMNPQVMAVDEITAPEDVAAIECAVGCGTTLLATAHGSKVEDLKYRPLYVRLLKMHIFQKVLIIKCENGMRRYRVEDMPC